METQIEGGKKLRFHYKWMKKKKKDSHEVVFHTHPCPGTSLKCSGNTAFTVSGRDVRGHVTSENEALWLDADVIFQVIKEWNSNHLVAQMFVAVATEAQSRSSNDTRVQVLLRQDPLTTLLVHVGWWFEGLFGADRPLQGSWGYTCFWCGVNE